VLSKVVFSTDLLPAELDDNQRLAQWNEVYSDIFCVFDMYRMDDHAFSARLELAEFGAVKSSRFEGALARAARTSRHIAASTIENFTLSFNRSRGAIRGTQRGIEATFGPGIATLFTDGEASTFDGKGGLDWLSVSVPRQRLVELVASPDDLLLTQFHPNAPAIHHLARYLDIILEPNGGGDDPILAAHIETTLLDLLTLALGGRRDMVDLARMRGLRSARLQEMLAAIRKGFSDPAFSSEKMAHMIGVSRRYANELLQESGKSFTERVLELRLQKARVMLANASHDRARVIEIAFACGFNDVSYFHRCFRRRFGASPAEVRGANGGRS
jgi:AraC-like DNA-binding protein